jgi:hypothetical protein
MLPLNSGEASCPVHPKPLFIRAEIGILPCSKCSLPMRLARFEPATPGYIIEFSNARSATRLEWLVSYFELGSAINS